MKAYKKLVCILLALLALAGCAKKPTPGESPTPGATATAQATSTPQPQGVDAYEDGYNPNYLCGVDQFGRAFMPISGFKDDKEVGIFYFLWHGQSGLTTYNITELLQTDPDALWDINGNAKSPKTDFHYWGEPLFGYYNSTDEWVMRKHIEMLTLAGVDFLVFDTTNGFTYDTVWKKLLKLLNEYLEAGWDVPKIVFYTNAYSTQKVIEIYNSCYKKNYYPNTWYRPNGDKPMIIGYTDPAKDTEVSYNAPKIPQEILDFFEFWEPQWPNKPYKSNGFPWMEWSYPQPEHNGVINVSVAQHPQLPFSASYFDRSKNWGRGYENGANNAEKSRLGVNFENQWKTVFEKDPKTVFITGWNEWIAQKLIISNSVWFVDCFNEEFSRDIEPMKGGYEDAFYLQMISNIRKFKGQTDKAKAPVKAAIDINAGADQWQSVTNRYLSVNQANYSRDAKSVDRKITYQIPEARNNIQEVKITHDENTLYFLIKTEKDITPYDGKPNWMNLFIGTGEVKLQGWESYNFVVNQNVSGSKTTVSALDAEANATAVGQGDISIQGNYMQLAIPLSLLGVTANDTGIYFKVADGVENYKDINDYYVTGKAMPMGRLSYYYYFN